MANSLDFYSTLHRPQNLRMHTHTVYTCGFVSPVHITYEPDAVFSLSCSLEYTQRSCAHVIATCHSAFCNSVQLMTVSLFNSTNSSWGFAIVLSLVVSTWCVPSSLEGNFG